MKKNYIDTMTNYSEAEKQDMDQWNKIQKQKNNEAAVTAPFSDVPDARMTTTSKDKPGLWENIQKKKERMGKNYKPAKPGDPDRPDPEALKKAQSS